MAFVGVDADILAAAVVHPGDAAELEGPVDPRVAGVAGVDIGVPQRPSSATPQHARLTLLQCISETAPEAPMAKVLT